MGTYDKDGIRFEYPENWTLDEENGDSRAIAVHSPGGAFWLVSPTADEDPDWVAEEALRALQEEYEDLESEPIEESVAGHELVGYDVNFWYLDLTNTSLIRSVRTDDATLLVLCQSEDREFDEVEEIFRAMTASLLKD